eukprot:CAMPEP_0177577664 /NCGR_PEP_ID=MMETSP0369-20130122/80753_1 /TAXON_ID=447022 ORGANISM="Scrippsiella hangoei-like, Strain SHHI-4" /NCGR_SAMPLE_ID=MMETSP0369 /ASSEMBLY_ACC=CAM_ASM_000364 /LENGTH=206 /DNA_ID=CAMNT_0019066001 /DNA_START=108 /DNA_END=724 /DNA_ORIENTATION=-
MQALCLLLRQARPQQHIHESQRGDGEGRLKVAHDLGMILRNHLRETAGPTAAGHVVDEQVRVSIPNGARVAVSPSVQHLMGALVVSPEHQQSVCEGCRVRLHPYAECPLHEKTVLASVTGLPALVEVQQGAQAPKLRIVAVDMLLVSAAAAGSVHRDHGLLAHVHACEPPNDGGAHARRTAPQRVHQRVPGRGVEADTRRPDIAIA